MLRAMRSIALALALLVLASGAVHARPLANRPAPAGFLDALWQWVASYVPGWVKEGGMIDPDGARPLKSDSGSSMDPNGTRPHLLPPSSTSDSGGVMDPNG
ncbi:MAG TPA: hypothetical protein VIJ36_12875 [Thermoanaerobaculia bacterium]